MSEQKRAGGAEMPPPSYPSVPAPSFAPNAVPPAHPGDDPGPADANASVPSGSSMPSARDDDAEAPAYPGDADPVYPGEALPVYPGEADSIYPEEAVPAYPGEAASSHPDTPVYPGEALPARPDEAATGSADGTTGPVRPVETTTPQPRAGYRAPEADGQDDLVLQTGRKHVKAYQRGVDGAALSQLVVTVPTALISLLLVGFVCSMVSPLIGLIAALLWLFSGPLVFQRQVEVVIARHLMGMRPPTPAEAERLSAVWGEVTRRAGVDQTTYRLWIQERAELNATAAAGHIVGVTRHAMESLPNSRLAAVLAHELGHHVGGHTWAGMLAEWYALPARTAGRLTIAILGSLFRSKKFAGVACGGCLSLFIVQALVILAFTESMWWLMLSVAAGPALIAWLNRRAEFRADAYAAGLGFGDELVEVLDAEHWARSLPPAFPQGTGPYGVPQQPLYAPPVQSPPAPGRARPDTTRLVMRAAHADFEARLRHLRRSMTDQ
ncbi:M48 family metalloprotease [Streptomyces sp. NPDC050529]|uniref:M48 family metalloprotease n=1 Tax=Streptomyces sp. NPDC050529 TaxID=3365624 RepID=UPI00378A7060